MHFQLMIFRQLEIINTFELMFDNRKHEIMKRISTLIIYPCLFSTLFFTSGCSNEEDIDDTPDAFVTNYVEDIRADNLELYVNWIQNYDSRFFLNDNRREIAFDIKNKFIQMGYSGTRIDSFYMSAEWDDETYNTWQYNVVARLEGSSSHENIVVMGAHYDCIVDEGDPFKEAPGANDNASGLASVLEVARVLKTGGFAPKNSIEFVAFAAEEYDLNGSTHYARNASATNANIIMMLNNDMISNASVSESSWTINVMDYANSSSLRSDFVSCGEIYTVLNFTYDNSYNEEGDSYSFYNEGFEALFIISDADDNNYHTSNDIAENCNFVYCREVTALSCAFLVQENK
jgi:leucyl aminopeptidase